jgi:hypothetical protein
MLATRQVTPSTEHGAGAMFVLKIRGAAAHSAARVIAPAPVSSTPREGTSHERLDAPECNAR